MTTATGIISWQAQISAFGDTKIDMQIASTRLAAENNHRFPGQYYDAETGLHQNYFRDYEASIGRYVQRDPIGLNGGINVFGYVGGRPVFWVDSTGLEVNWSGSIYSGGASIGLGGAVMKFEFTSECKCNKIVTVKGFASFLTIGIKGKAGGGGGVNATTPFDCPNATHFAGPAWISGVGATFLTTTWLGFAEIQSFGGPSTWTIDIGLHSTVYGHSAVYDFDVTEACCD
jgi:RHS repeat-associated protein